jgi:hypothetical protein
MRILRLDRLQPGDVILETGMTDVADATGGPFGHAALALGRLIKIEAGKHEGVVLTHFDFSAFRCGSERIVGVPVTDGDMKVMRRKHGLDLATIRAAALLEAGRNYCLVKSLSLPDLAAAPRKMLTSKLRGRRASPDPQGRICSEVAARVLDLAEKVVSPNALADADELQEIQDALIKLDGDWVPDPTWTATNVLGEKVAAIELGLAKRAMELAVQGVATIRRESSERRAAAQEAVVDQLEATLEAELRRSISLLLDIEKLEATILHTEIEPV